MMKILTFIVRRVLSLRYKVSLIGKEHLKHDGPILILPNHVALVDPRILLSFLWKYIKVSPVASEMYYNMPVLKQVMQIFWTVPIWDMSAWANSEEVQKVFWKITQWLEEGKNILIYPSGQIYRQWFESIKWKQSAYHIVNGMPENTKILGIKTRGLWGSIWSKAWDNGKTSFWKAYLKSIFYVFANVIFFVPKRSVSIEIHDMTQELVEKSKSDLQVFNTYLENFYNTQDWKKYEEKIHYIQHYFYYDDVNSRKEPEIISGSEAELLQANHYDLSGIDESIKNCIKEKIAEMKEIPISKLEDNTHLILDIFLDSLDIAEVKSFVQSQFAWASNPPLREIKTLWDLFVMAIWKSSGEEELKKCDWKKTQQEIKRLSDIIQFDSWDTIASLWKKEFSKNKKDSFLWDNIFGLQSKKDYIIKAYVISHCIKKVPGEYVGIMLPALGSASLLIMATYLAGKIPVMFNWTLGKEAFNHCVNFSKVETILTARSFYDAVSNDFLEEHKQDGRFLFLEDTLKKVPMTLKISSLLKSIYMPIKSLPSTAVILFTSWSESLPKAVSLKHQNIIENIKGSLDVFHLKSDDILIGFLPPFHSFWFTVNTIMPLITWLRVSYTPDPNDAKTILDTITHTWVTGITGTPTFLKMVMSLADKNDFKNIRYSVVGAEKCPDDVFEKFSELSPDGKVLEWYGITECSPVVAINPIESSQKWTVWKILPNLESKILDVDTGKVLGPDQQGMIYVSGPSIFSGYLDESIESPFEDISGKKYYKTWDLWKIDSQGFLTITWRLKRFVKIAGEMISLPFIEELLWDKYAWEDEVTFAIEALEENGETKIVFFSTDTVEIDDINTELRKQGASNLVKISEVIQVPEIPVLGTGKTDYKQLKKMIQL